MVSGFRSARKDQGESVNRRSIRLKDYDYLSEGMYFVTICTQDRQHVFGEIADGVMGLNNAGQMIQESWKQLPERFDTVKLDEFIVMPNHVHGIIAIVGAPFMAPNDHDGIANKGAINRAPTLGEIIRTFKAVSTRQIHLSGLNEFKWQRNYYEHVIRNENELFKTRQYVQENPIKWELDPENVAMEGKEVLS
ncbi:MAG: transposase [Candidatus Omnitrophica bacterium]|nr:transposase [Candidatus Omnitrophota bacterium]